MGPGQGGEASKTSSLIDIYDISSSSRAIFLLYFMIMMMIYFLLRSGKILSFIFLVSRAQAHTLSPTRTRLLCWGWAQWWKNMLDHVKCLMDHIINNNFFCLLLGFCFLIQANEHGHTMYVNLLWFTFDKTKWNKHHARSFLCHAIALSAELRYNIINLSWAHL